MRLERAMFELAALSRKADVAAPMRISISFATQRDHAVFKAEIMRECKALKGLWSDSVRDVDQFHMCGVEVRLLS